MRRKRTEKGRDKEKMEKEKGGKYRREGRRNGGMQRVEVARKI